MTPRITDLLHFDPRDRASLTWLQKRARFWLNAAQRRYLPPDEPYDENEETVLQALADIEEATGILLKRMSLKDRSGSASRRWERGQYLGPPPKRKSAYSRFAPARLAPCK